MPEAGTVAAFREAVMVLQTDVINIAGECLLEHKQEVVGVLVQQQHEEGVSGTGAALKPYTNDYRKRKIKRGVYTGHTDYSLTGKMQGEMNLTVSGSEYSIDSPATANDGNTISSYLKKRDLQSFELTEENKGVVWRIIAPTFNEKVGSRFD